MNTESTPENRKRMEAFYETKQVKRMQKAATEEAIKLIEENHTKGIFDEGDPNHPKYNNGINYKTLFGYPIAEFLAKQYK